MKKGLTKFNPFDIIKTVKGKEKTIMAINENKKVRKAKNAQKRVLIPFNTGIRTHKSKKDYNRQKMKKINPDY